MRIGKIFSNEQGAVLVTGLMFLTILTLIGTTAYFTTSNELKTSRNYRISKQALYDAEAGIEFAISRIEGYLVSDTTGYTLPTATGDTNSLPAFSLSDFTNTFNFSLSEIEKDSYNNTWKISSTGSYLESSAEIEVLFQKIRKPVVNYAAFGDKKSDLKSNALITSFNSSVDDPCLNDITNPCYDKTAGNGDVGSNGTVDVNSGVEVYGDIALGDDGADPPGEAVLIGAGAPPVSDDIDRVNPDPLGIDSGGVYDPDYYEPAPLGSTPAQIAAQAEKINNDELGIGTTLTTTTTLCPRLGGGETSYYFTSINIGNNQVITIDTEGTSATCQALNGGIFAGHVNIFLDSPTANKPFQMGNGADIVVPSKKTTEFSIFSNSNSTLEMKNSSSFYGLVYAPKASFQTKNSSAFAGAIWANEVEMFASSSLYYDEALSDGLTWESDDIGISLWRNLRN